MKKRQLWDRGFRRISSLQAAWDTSNAIFASCVGYFERAYYGFYVTSSRMLSPYWGGQNLTTVELSECINMWLWIRMRPFLLTSVWRNLINSSMRGKKWSCITRWIGQTTTRNRTQNMSGEWKEWWVSIILCLFPIFLEYGFSIIELFILMVQFSSTYIVGGGGYWQRSFYRRVPHGGLVFCSFL